MHIGITNNHTRTHKQEVKKVRGSKDKGKDKSEKKGHFQPKKKKYIHPHTLTEKERGEGRERKKGEKKQKNGLIILGKKSAAMARSKARGSYSSYCTI